MANVYEQNLRELDLSKIKLIEQPDSDMVQKIRGYCFDLIRKQKDVYHQNIDLNDLSYGGFNDCEGDGFRSIHLVQKHGLDPAGLVIADVFPKKDDPILDYCLVVLYDYTSFEIITERSDKTITRFYKDTEQVGYCVTHWYPSTFLHLFDRGRKKCELYFGDDYFGIFEWPKGWFKGELLIKRQNGQQLPIRVDINDRISEFFLAIFKLLTLYPLWANKNKLYNRHTVIIRPIEQELTSFYFVISVAFMVLFFDLVFRTSE